MVYLSVYNIWIRTVTYVENDVQNSTFFDFVKELIQYINLYFL